MIDLAPEHLETVRMILQKHVPGCEVRAFGSRCTGAAKKHSDLDLAIIGNERLDPDTMRLLKEAFEESVLPIRVDIVDWHGISPGFRQIIEAGCEVIQSP